LTNDELTPLFEEMKRVLKDKIDDETLRSELDKYLNEYHVDVDAAKRGILRKYGAIDSATAAGMSIVKKISALTGTEQNVDVIAKIASSERRSLKNKGLDKTVVSGTLGDETGTVQFTIWEPGSAEYPAGSVYAFRNCYCKVWNGNVQLNVGNRGRVEPVDANIEVSEKTVGVPSESKTISQLNGSEQNVDITAKVVAVEQRTINTRNGEKTVTSGTIGDRTGTVPFTIWEPMDLALGAVYEFKGCYCKSWNGSVQVSLGNQGSVTPSFADVGDVEYFPSVQSSEPAPGEPKKISDLDGTEQNVDLRVKVVAVEQRTINTRNGEKTVTSGTIGDETGTVPFTIWEPADVAKGGTYAFKNCYCKIWSGKPQVNIGNKGRVEPINAVIDVSELSFDMSGEESRIRDVHEGSGNVNVRGRIMSVEVRDVVIRGENRTVWSGIIADETGRIQYSAWKDFGLKEGDSVRITGAYVRAWKSIPQLNLGERCEVSRIDSDFQPVGSGGSLRTVGEIMRAGGGVDLDVEGLVVDVRAGSGLIKRCPQCRRSILNGVCVAHGPVEGVSDLRLKAVIDDGTGAIGAVIGRADTEKLSGMTLDEAASLSARLGEGAVSARLASAVLMKRVRASGNVTVDDFGPSINVNGIKVIEVDVPAEAEALLKDVEANLS
jgi:replication factor A1